MADWQKGDQALCVKVGPWVNRQYPSGVETPSRGPRAGQFLTVRNVQHGPSGTYLLFEDFPDPPSSTSLGYNVTRFRKVTPPKPTADDREVIDLMNRKTVEA